MRNSPKTEALIEHLVANLAPSPKPKIVTQGTSWFVVSLLSMLAYLALFRGLRVDLVEQLSQGVFLFTLVISIIAVVASLSAAYVSAIPGNKSIFSLLAISTSCTFVAITLHGAFINMIEYPPNFIPLYPDWHISLDILAMGIIPFLVLRQQLCYLAPTRPIESAALASIASFGLAMVLSRLAYQRMWGVIDDYLSLLVWIVLPTILICCFITVYIWFKPELFHRQAQKHNTSLINTVVKLLKTLPRKALNIRVSS